MSYKSFGEWLQARESTAFTRARSQAAKGLGPDMPDAEINSHDTAPPWQQKLFKKKHKKGGKKKD